MSAQVINALRNRAGALEAEGARKADNPEYRNILRSPEHLLFLAGEFRKLAVLAEMYEPNGDVKVTVIAPEYRAEYERLIEQHGQPEGISPSGALALAATARVPVDPGLTADDVFASIYRDDAAADAYEDSGRVHHAGYPTLAKFPLPDGRVVILTDLRPTSRLAQEGS